MNYYEKSALAIFCLFIFLLTSCFNNDLYTKANESFESGEQSDSKVFNPAGVLDPEFNENGIFVHSNASGGNADDVAKDIMTDSNGNIYAVGFSQKNSTSYFAVWKITNKGALDTEFGNSVSSSGILVWDKKESEGNGIALDTSGYLVGTGQIKDDDTDMALWRCSFNGTPVDSFGNGAVVQHDSASMGTTANSNDGGTSNFIDASGNIYVVGYSSNGSSNEQTLWKYNQAGNLDSSFSEDGYHSSELFSNSSGNDLVVDGSGNIYVAGLSFNSSTNFTIWKYKADGPMDSSFGNGGYIISNDPYGTFSIATSIDLDSNENIVVCGFTNNGTNNELIVRKYKNDGSVDTSFNGSGYTTYNSPYNQDIIAHSLAVAPDDSIYVCGAMHNGKDTDIILWKFTSQGILDSSFASNGIFTYNQVAGGGSTNNDFAYSIHLDLEGYIYLGGSSDNGTDEDMVILRLK